MSDSDTTKPFRRPTLVGASIAVLAIALAACSSGSPSPSAGANQSQAAGQSQAAASQAASARCAFTPDASPSATIQVLDFSFGGEATVQAGQAVAFANGQTRHTITEGTGGTAAANACVDEPIAGGQSVIVTFSEPGDYQVTCKIHSSMQTVVHVQ